MSDKVLMEWLKDRLDRLEDKVDGLRSDVTTLKVKAGLWGSAAGVVVGAIASLIVSFVTK